MSLLTFAIEVNQNIELAQYVNARYSARFTKSDDNIAGKIAAGTKGQVREIKTFNSGNSGLLILVKDGELKNQKVWVYFNKVAPTVKLSDEKSQPTSDPLKADQVQATQTTPVLPVPVTPQTVVSQIEQVNRELIRMNSDLQGAKAECETCKNSNPGQSGGLPETSLEIATAETAGGQFNARITCSHRSDQGMTLAGSIQLEIVNNKVKNLKATVNGCSVTSQDFKQVAMPNNNIVLRDKNGCDVVITSNLKIRTPANAPVLNFGMVPTTECVKSCAKVEKKYWQIEMNPNSQTCY